MEDGTITDAMRAFTTLNPQVQGLRAQKAVTRKSCAAVPVMKLELTRCKPYTFGNPIALEIRASQSKSTSLVRTNLTGVDLPNTLYLAHSPYGKPVEFRWDEKSKGPATRDKILGQLRKEGYNYTTYTFGPGTVFGDHSHGCDKKDSIISGKFFFRMGGEEVHSHRS